MNPTSQETPKSKKVSAPDLVPRVTQIQAITDTLEKNYMPYAMSVIVSRAIPEIDGFKPSHRKLLYTMYKMGLMGQTRTKSANVVGQTMRLNPHGDQAIYDTMVRLTRGNKALLHAYIDSKGNFGRHYSRDMQHAAARYTEVRLDKICEQIFNGLDKDAVDFIDNYDNTTLEPTLLPAAFPTILVNSNQGIAVGMASNICSFNLKEVCEATVLYMKDSKADLLSVMPAPDFSGGGVILYDEEQMRQIFETGRGPIRVRAQYQVMKNKNMIEITQIPYSTTVEAIIDEISELVKSGKIKDINDIRDETDLDGLRIAIEYKRSADPEALMTKLFRFTKLQDTFSCNFNILINGKPRVLGVRDIISQWLIWRRVCLKRELSYEHQKKSERLHVLDGLAKILLDIDRAILIIRQTEKEADVILNLMNGFSIDEAQADYVAEIKLRNINRQYILKRTVDRQRLIEEIAELDVTLNSQQRMDTLIRKHLQDVAAKFGIARQSAILCAEEAKTFSQDQMIEDYRLKLYLTDHGYVKKIPLTSLRSAGELKTKEDDHITVEMDGRNKIEVLFFSDKSCVYKIKAHELSDTKPSELGTFLPNILPMQDGEKIVYALTTEDYGGDIFYAFENGKMVKIPLEVYATKTNRKRLINAYSDKAPVVAILHLLEDIDLAAFSDEGKAIAFSSKLIPQKPTRTTQGVQVFPSKKGRLMTACAPLSSVGFLDPEYYRIRKIPAIGYYVKENTLFDRQMRMGDES